MQAEIIELEQARRRRSLAARARQLAKTIHDQNAAAKVADYADNLEQLHELCVMLRETVARTKALGAEVEEFCTREGHQLRDYAAEDAVPQARGIDLPINKRVGKPSDRTLEDYMTTTDFERQHSGDVSDDRSPSCREVAMTFAPASGTPPTMGSSPTTGPSLGGTEKSPPARVCEGGPVPNNLGRTREPRKAKVSLPIGKH